MCTSGWLFFSAHSMRYLNMWQRAIVRLKLYISRWKLNNWDRAWYVRAFKPFPVRSSGKNKSINAIRLFHVLIVSIFIYSNSYIFWSSRSYNRFITATIHKYRRFVRHNFPLWLRRLHSAQIPNIPSTLNIVLHQQLANWLDFISVYQRSTTTTLYIAASKQTMESTSKRTIHPSSGLRLPLVREITSDTVLVHSVVCSTTS